MKTRKWCKCIRPVICGFGPVSCLTCGELILNRILELPKDLRKLPIKITLDGTQGMRRGVSGNT